MRWSNNSDQGSLFNSESILYAKLHSKFPGIEFQFFDKGHSLKGSLAADIFEYTGQLNEEEHDLIGAAALLVVAGLFIPSSIEIKWDSQAARYREFIDILQILYDVRAYCSKIPFFSPSIKIRPSYHNIKSNYPKSLMHSFPSSAKTFSHVLLFSGGIDSTYSMLQLLEQGHKPVALFLGVNTDTLKLEREASRRIASELDVTFLHCDLEMKGFPKKGADPLLWPQFGQFPYYNSIPHGRDILSAAIASIIARRINSFFIAFGQEKESREKVIFYRGRKIFRHDIESHEGSRLLNSWLIRCLRDELQLVSPIESYSIEDIRVNMINFYPDFLSMTQSCFWERLCGKCVKCISLYLIQRVMGADIIKFPTNPLADANNLDLADAVNSQVPDNEIGYGTQIRKAIKRIIESGTYSQEDYWILRAMEESSSLFQPDFGSPKKQCLLNHTSPRP